MDRTKALVWLVLLAAAPVTVPAAKDRPAEGAAEQKVLDRFLGKWQGTVTTRKAKWSPEEQRLTGTSSTVRVLGGRFIRSNTEASDGSTSLTLTTYDVQRECYRMWYFDSQGFAAESTGKWDAEKKTMTMHSDHGDGITTVGEVRVVDGNTVEWSSVTRDREGTVCLHVNVENSRVQQPDSEKIHVRVPVRFAYAGAVVSEAQITPPTMGIRVARGDWQKILKAQPNPVLRTVTVDLKALKADEPIDVRIIPRIGLVPVEPDQKTVKVKATVARPTEARELTVPVQVVVPTKWMEDGTWQEFTLMRRDPAKWRVKIQVTGVRRDLDMLRAEDVLAYVTLTDDDKKPISWLTRSVKTRLPPQLDLKLLGDHPSVAFKLTRRIAHPPE